MGEAFKPLGVYMNFWQRTPRAGSSVFNVMMVNDEYAPAAGKLALTLVSPEGGTLASSETRFELAALGQQTYRITLQIPARSGAALLRAEAARDGAKRRAVGKPAKGGGGRAVIMHRSVRNRRARQ